jgi:hypothetical protein
MPSVQQTVTIIIIVIGFQGEEGKMEAVASHRVRRRRVYTDAQDHERWAVCEILRNWRVSIKLESKVTHTEKKKRNKNEMLNKAHPA